MSIEEEAFSFFHLADSFRDHNHEPIEHRDTQEHRDNIVNGAAGYRQVCALTAYADICQLL